MLCAVLTVNRNFIFVGGADYIKERTNYLFECLFLEHLNFDIAAYLLVLQIRASIVRYIEGKKIELYE